MTCHGTEQDPGDTVTSVCQECCDQSCRNYSHKQGLEEAEEKEDCVACQEAALAQSKTRDCCNGSKPALASDEASRGGNYLTDEDIDTNVAADAHLCQLGDQCLLYHVCGQRNLELEQCLSGEVGGRGETQALGEEKNSCLYVAS